MMLVYSLPAWLPSTGAIFNHLWQSTWFAALAALLTLALKKNQARWRCRLWLAASIKFLIPFSVLAGIGSQLGWHAPRLAPAGLWIMMEEAGQSLAPPVAHHVVVSGSDIRAQWAVSLAPAILLMVWFCGFAFALFRWRRSWSQIRAVVRGAVPVTEGRELDALRRMERSAGHGKPIRLLASKGRLEPGVLGIFRAVLLWPAGISQHLADRQLEAIMAHEVCHVRRRDNLAAAVHMVVEAIFWFHPLVWWLGARLVDEREKACDEEVLRMGSEPEVYAESILKTCQFYLESPRLCMAGVTGSDLKKRIERIMSRRMGRQLDLGRKLLLAAAGIAAVAGPIVFGVAHTPSVRAQSQAAAAPAFEVASIKPNHSDDHRVSFQITPGGRVVLTNAPPAMLIMMAYNLKPHQLEGVPEWLHSTSYDITAKAEGAADRDQVKLMMQKLLVDRFKLAYHRETKQLPIYELIAGKSGPKLQPAPAEAGPHKGLFRIGRGQLNLEGGSMAELADNLSRMVGRNVMDRTGIAGAFNIKLEWTPDESEEPLFKGGPDGREGAAPPAPETTGPSLFTALQEQLGLKLEAAKGPVEIMVIDHIEKASEN